jgi:hypothetical protein
MSMKLKNIPALFARWVAQSLFSNTAAFPLRMVTALPPKRGADLHSKTLCRFPLEDFAAPSPTAPRGDSQQGSRQLLRSSQSRKPAATWPWSSRWFKAFREFHVVGSASRCRTERRHSFSPASLQSRHPAAAPPGRLRDRAAQTKCVGR